MAIVEITNLPKPVAVALDWHLLPGTTSERKEIDALTKRTGAKFGCVLADDEAGLTIVGLSTDKKESVNCGAAWLAKASGGEAMVLVEPLENGRIWLCAVRAGLPVQGMDVVIEPAQLHERLREFLDDGGEAKLCSTLENLDQVYANVVPQSFAELVANTKPERVRRISGINPTLAVAAGLLAVIFGGWYGVDYYVTKMRQQEAQAKLQQMNALQQKQAAEQRAAAKLERLEAGRTMIRQVVLEKPSVESLVGAYLNELSAKPLTIGGWTLTGYDCSVLACSLTWQRKSSGTIATFIKAAEDNGWTVDKVEGNDAVTTHAVQAAPRNNTIDELSEDAPFRAALETRLQEAGSNGLRYELSKSDPLDKMMGAAATSGDPNAGPPGEGSDPLPYWVGTLTVKGSTLFELRELPEYIGHPGLSVKNVRGDLKTNEWTMELNYATR
jgi:hypothetical protein